MSQELQPALYNDQARACSYRSREIYYRNYFDIVLKLMFKISIQNNEFQRGVFLHMYHPTLL